jgi:Mg/Co/Ni transporter MgtE
MGSSTLTRTDAFGVITKETTSGLCMRLVLGSIIGPVAHYVMGIHVQVATVVSTNLTISVKSIYIVFMPLTVCH